MPVLKRWLDDDRERLRVKLEQSRRDLEAESSWSLHDYRYDDNDALNQAFPGKRWGLAPIGYNEASGSLNLDTSNFEYTKRTLEAINHRVEEITIHHFVGGIRVYFLVVPTDDADVMDELAEIIWSLDSYPVLDEEDYDDREYASWRESLTWHDDVTEDNVEEVAYELSKREIHRESDVAYNESLEDIVREITLKLGYREPDEDEEDLFSAADDAYLALSQLGLTYPELEPAYTQDGLLDVYAMPVSLN